MSQQARILTIGLATAIAACGPTGNTSGPSRPTAGPTGPAAVTDTPAAPVAAALSMTADEAAARALARLDPERDPRVELVRLVPAGRLRDLWPPDACCAELALSDDGPLFVAVVSTPGLPLLSWRHRAAETPASPACALAAPERLQLTVLFDAATGDELGAWTVADETFASAVGDLLPPSVDEEAGALLRAARAPTDAPAAPVRRPLPASRFLAPPEWSPFEPAQLSGTAMAALRGYPLAPNHWWAYQVSAWTGPTAGDPGSGRWRRAAFTETVHAAWLLGPESAVFDLERGIRWLWPPDHDPTTEPIVVRERPDKVLLDGSSFYPSTRADVAPLSRLPATAGDLWALGASDNPSQRWEVRAVEELVTAAGTFDACVAVRRMVGAGTEHWRWLCPGVGIVREERVACGAGARAAAVIELTGYDVSTSLAP